MCTVTTNTHSQHKLALSNCPIFTTHNHTLTNTHKLMCTLTFTIKSLVMESLLCTASKHSLLKVHPQSGDRELAMQSQWTHYLKYTDNLVTDSLLCTASNVLQQISKSTGLCTTTDDPVPWAMYYNRWLSTGLCKGYVQQMIVPWAMCYNRWLSTGLCATTDDCTYWAMYYNRWLCPKGHVL